MIYAFENRGGASPPVQNAAKRTIVPPLTNGGMIRSMDNRQLAAWLAETMFVAAKCGELSEDEYFRWLEEPNVTGRSVSNAHDREAKASQLKRRYSVSELVAELRTREGVETTVVEPYYEGSLRVSGPAVILNVTD